MAPGGHRRGAEAARRAVARIEAMLRDDTMAFSPANLTQIVRLAHAELQHHQDSEFCRRTHALHDGRAVDRPGQPDTRCGRMSATRACIACGTVSIDFVTSDDSVVQRMVQAGLITLDQSHQHPQKNQLVAALGIEGEIEPHTVVRAVELLEGDAFLLCSDGWWEPFDGAAIAASLARALTPEDWLAEMRAQIASRAKPRQDNFSAIAVWVGDPGEVTRPGADDTRPRQAPLS